MYEAGDKVLVVCCTHGIKPMENLVGQICTISKASNGYYFLEEDNNVYFWRESWLKPVANEIQEISNDEMLNLIGW